MQQETDRANGHEPESQDATVAAMRAQLLAEIDAVIGRLRQLDPEFVPRDVSAESIIHAVRNGIRTVTPGFAQGWLDQLGDLTENLDPLDPDTWRGLWYIISYTAQSYADLAKRRAAGNFETDEWGYDPEFYDIVRPLVDFLYTHYWRVEVIGIEHVPDDGAPGILVANHSGQVPFDAGMIATAVAKEHFDERQVRPLYQPWVSTVSPLSTLLRKSGYADDSAESAASLIDSNQLIAVFPEGVDGSSKLFWNRYQLAQFGNDRYVRLALRSGAPLIPVAVIGAEETYITVAHAQRLAGLLGVPYVPITLRFPWLGLLSAIPYPTKWTILFGPPIEMGDHGPDSAENDAVVAAISDQTRRTIQTMLNEHVARRNSIFLG